MQMRGVAEKGCREFIQCIQDGHNAKKAMGYRNVRGGRRPKAAATGSHRHTWLRACPGVEGWTSFVQFEVEKASIGVVHRIVPMCTVLYVCSWTESSLSREYRFRTGSLLLPIHL